MAETKSQKVFGANSYVCRSYMGKGGSGAFLDTPHEIVHLTFFCLLRILLKRSEVTVLEADS